VSAVDRAVTALREGKSVVIPTDTVYGLAASPYTPEPVRRLSELKGRDPAQPIALVVSDVDLLLECVPELRGSAGVVARALLPGPYTLVLPNPAHRYRWLAGDVPDTIGVRVPVLTGVAGELLARVGAVAATSANAHGGQPARRLADVPDELRAACAEAVDGGELPGTASTVLDFTGPEPRVLRDGAAPGAEALERAAAALS
jgi:tRNA threonylcarbamoyl adenosine modification protein (Sua5/YciO/YrdC/YwlC family)